MPRGPDGQWRPEDPVSAAVMVAKIATRQIEECYCDRDNPSFSEHSDEVCRQTRDRQRGRNGTA